MEKTNGYHRGFESVASREVDAAQELAITVY